MARPQFEAHVYLYEARDMIDNNKNQKTEGSASGDVSDEKISKHDRGSIKYMKW